MASVADAFTQIADKNSDLLWLIAEWDRATNGLALVESGSSNLDDFKSKLNPAKVQFAVFKVYGVDQQESVTSKRDKLVAITFVGPNVSPLQRNAVLNSRQYREQTFRGVVTEVQADSLDEISDRIIAKTLLAIGGAHKPSHYSFGPGQDVPLVGMAIQ